MKGSISLLAILLIFLTTSCSAEMKGVVVDEETGKPIEGAVVLVEWTHTSGKWIGLRTTSTYKVVEKVTDKEGRFEVADVFNPLVDSPYVTVYKKGYVAWNNKFIFPDYTKRKDFQWQDNNVFKLEIFRPEYSYNEHVSFISSAVHSWSVSENKGLFKKAYEWEENEAFKERQNKKLLNRR